VGKGLETTLKFLGKSKNDAASLLLVPALDHTDPAIRDGALKAILDRRSTPGQREIVHRFHQLHDSWKQILLAAQPRMTTVLRDALNSRDPQLAENASQAAIWFHDYEFIPALVTVAEDENHASQDLAARTILQLADVLYDELAHPSDTQRRTDPHSSRERVISVLERSVMRFSLHRRHELLESFLLLVNRDNPTLRQIMHDPLHPSFTPLTEMLGRSSRPGVIRLILNFVDDPQPPTSGLHVIARRGDSRFVDRLLKKIGAEPATQAKHNLARIENIPWLRDAIPVLDEPTQYAAVQLAVHSGMKRPEVLSLLQLVLRDGNVSGRRAAAKALVEFTGAEANTLALAALQDRDPLVQAEIARQLRPRGIANAMNKLIALLDSPQEVVRQAAREGLNEFNFPKFLQKFDWMSDEARQQTGPLVARVDLQSTALLAGELKAASRTRRMRALAVGRALGIVAEVEELVTALLRDEDHLVRNEAAKTLADCGSAAACAALREALLDHSMTVQETAEESLQAILSRRPALAGAGPNTIAAALAAQPSPEEFDL